MHLDAVEKVCYIDHRVSCYLENPYQYLVMEGMPLGRVFVQAQNRLSLVQCSVLIHTGGNVILACFFLKVLCMLHKHVFWSVVVWKSMRPAIYRFL